MILWGEVWFVSDFYSRTFLFFLFFIFDLFFEIIDMILIEHVCFVDFFYFYSEFDSQNFLVSKWIFQLISLLIFYQTKSKIFAFMLYVWDYFVKCFIYSNGNRLIVVALLNLLYICEMKGWNALILHFNCFYKMIIFLFVFWELELKLKVIYAVDIYSFSIAYWSFYLVKLMFGVTIKLIWGSRWINKRCYLALIW